MLKTSSTEKNFHDTSLAVSSHWTLERLVKPLAETESPTLVSLRDQLLKISRLWAPEKKALGHKFDDAIVKDTHTRLANALSLFTR